MYNTIIKGGGNMVDVSKRINELMQERGWTEYRLVKESNLPASTVANIFHRKSVPSIATLENICDAFGISLCQFFATDNMFSLNEEQALLVQRWSTLNNEQKHVILDLLSKME